ncbi:MAG: bifunctional 2-polyprenyl-6-hydroxyphenol methylase/3-demethylubiquinol 3-O-methyltransferase UbiG [Pseudomonadota bacterium]
MNNATSPNTIRPTEAAHFGKMAADWWNPKGSSAMLHRLNPVRLGFIRAAIDEKWPTDSRQIRPLSGKQALDVGCGAGLLCEPLARLGAEVTGVDAAAENIAAATDHAAMMGLLSPLPTGGSAAPASPLPFRGGAGGGVSQTNATITYLHGDIAALSLTNFHLVTALEVIEHVADKSAFLAALTAALADEGLMILSTPNRTAKSRLLLVEGAERLGMIPRGTHHHHDFITPDELRDFCTESGLTMGTPRGIGWSPAKGLHISDDLSLNYIVTAKRAK